MTNNFLSLKLIVNEIFSCNVKGALTKEHETKN